MDLNQTKHKNEKKLKHFYKQTIKSVTLKCLDIWCIKNRNTNFFHKYTISTKMSEIYDKFSKYELYSEMIFFKWGFFPVNALLFCWKSAKFAILCN